MLYDGEEFGFDSNFGTNFETNEITSSKGKVFYFEVKVDEDDDEEIEED